MCDMLKFEDHKNFRYFFYFQVASLVYLIDLKTGHLFADKEKNNRLPENGITQYVYCKEK